MTVTFGLADVKHAFPLPGAYHFRFKRGYKNTYVWLDVSNDADVVPVHDGFIMTKVSRIYDKVRAYMTKMTKVASFIDSLLFRFSREAIHPRCNRVNLESTRRRRRRGRSLRTNRVMIC